MFAGNLQTGIEHNSIDVPSNIHMFWGSRFAMVEMKHKSSTNSWPCTQKLKTFRERGHICRNTCNRQPAVGKVSTFRPVAACCGSGMTPRPSFCILHALHPPVLDRLIGYVRGTKTRYGVMLGSLSHIIDDAQISSVWSQTT
jgi:hypothetical protein